MPPVSNRKKIKHRARRAGKGKQQVSGRISEAKDVKNNKSTSGQINFLVFFLL